MLALDSIDTFYGETQALFGVSLAVAAGEVVALLGPNGAARPRRCARSSASRGARAGA
jgi:branched-chain amino acid transport system ATP-binding protein